MASMEVLTGLKQHIFPFTDLYKDAYHSAASGWLNLSHQPQCIWHSTGSYAIPIMQNGEQVEEVMKSHPNTIFVHGHDHSLQYHKRQFSLHREWKRLKVQRVVKTSKTPYAKSEVGFATLEISKNKNVTVVFM